MIFIGNHVSIKDGYYQMGEKEKELGGNTFAFFTRNPRGGKDKELSEEEAVRLSSFLKENRFGPLVAHMPYTMNLCSDKEDIRKYSVEMFQKDLLKMEKIKNQYLNFHPGGRLSNSVDEAIELISSSLNQIMFQGQTTTILLETMAGKGSEVGRTFEELAEIMKKVKVRDRIGVCLDTCHVFDAGYDIVNRLDDVLDSFDHVIGLEHLCALHLNDSKNSMGSHKDRHEKLGFGNIGKEALVRIIQHPLLQNRPFILETPNDDIGYRNEISFVKSVMTQSEKL